MSKKKNDLTGAHTEEKLAIYRNCLYRCLSVLVNQPTPKKITVCEPFAGSGVVGAKLKGSASHAVEVIDDFLKRDNCKCQIELLLNELDPDSYSALCKKFSERHFVSVTNTRADEFINDTLDKKGVQRGMFFIDPYGYTQVKPRTLDRLFRFQVDIIIFVPTHQIYRFVKDDETTGKLGPVRKFLESCGIDKRSFASVENLEEALVRNFKKRAKTNFGYKYDLRSQEAAYSRHCLFFITNHVAGARKFLEGIKEIKGIRESQPGFQYAIFDIDAGKHRKAVLSCLKKERGNYELYERLISKGLLPKEANPILKQLESDGVISVAEVSSGSRYRKSFYLDSVEKKVLIKKISARDSARPPTPTTPNPTIWSPP